MKLAVIGGGSSYTPELVEGIARRAGTLPVGELVLVDPAADRLAVVGGLATRMLARVGSPVTVRTTCDMGAGLDGALDGAAAVLVQLRVGGQAARLSDETFPLACGCVGQETTGAGGLAKALRTVPVVLELAERVRERAPGAWIVDFTNPVGIITRALLDAGHRAIGLCNVAITFQRRFAGLLGVEPGRLSLGHVGLNHLTWERAVRLDGADVLPRLLDEHLGVLAEETGLPAGLIRRLGAVPSYYLRYYYEHDRVVGEQRATPARAAKVAEIERRLMEMYADPALDTKPALLGERGGAHYSEAAADLLAALLGEAPGTQVVNVRNEGTLPFLPPEAVIEVPTRITAAGAAPLPVPPVEPLLAGLIAHVSAYEEIAVAAALHGGADRVTDALLAHPLVGQADAAERLARELISEGRAHLPWAANG
ncbi:family 4 glycosyl hydrolase [Actinomadura rudentiformis]|uniref:6-phospho-beta-glucosidase n=1 Tax=Actinomadura rudentiformis TaxID=359158 RepID=A0A6H9Z0Y8_9ACTN|nr:6-phospho-beta-glucosidase [Actinomadura rudentiformis]KAB2348980.1 6-phospho-beta-glucosidase [Actinomadura rudentiformis]